MIRSSGRTLARLGALLVLAAACTGCAMTESTLIDAVSEQACESDSGAYYLSRTMFEVLVTTDAPNDQKLHPQKPSPDKKGETYADALNANNKLISVQSRAVADRKRGYCLDFLASPTAQEAIHVQRSDGLLTKITTDSQDRSADILKNVVKTILLAGLGGEEGGSSLRSADEADAPLKPKQLFKATYDPLDPEQTSLINHTLRQHGFCLVIEEQEWQRPVRSIQEYCDRPLGRSSREAALDNSAAFEGNGPMVAHARGILYRPRVAYNYYLFVMKRGNWTLRKSVTVNLENAAPVLAVGIDRAFFTNRKTAISFDAGVLKDVRVEKGSELASFVEVPLAVAQGVVALPANIVKVKIDLTNQRTTLIAAQDQLLAAQKSYLEDVERLKAAQDPKSKAKDAGPSPDQGKLPGEVADAAPRSQPADVASGGQADASPAMCEAYDRCIASGVPPQTCKVAHPCP